jgi:biotin carboxylase
MSVHATTTTRLRPRTVPAHEASSAALLAGKRILIVQAGPEWKRPLYEKMRALGIRLTVLDGPGHWARELVAAGVAEQVIEVSQTPVETYHERALAAVRRSGLEFDGVTTFLEFGLPLTAHLAEALGLPGHSPRAVARSRNKVETRVACRAAGIPTPRFARIRRPEDLEGAARLVGFPAILKPISGAGSARVYRIEGEAELRASHRQICAEAASDARPAESNSGGLDELLACFSGVEMVLEEYLEGEEFDVDCLLSRRELVYAAVTRDLPQPQYQETGSQMPPPFPQAVQRELTELARRVLVALGYSDGVYHVELKYTPSGPRLIEVNARLGGGPMYLMNKLVWGVDLVEQHLLTVIGERIRPSAAPAPLTCLVEFDLPAPYSGVVDDERFLEAIAGDTRVVRAASSVRAGERVSGPEHGAPSWLGMLIVRGETVEAAAETLVELVGRLRVPVAPDVGAETADSRGPGAWLEGLSALTPESRTAAA